MTSPKIQLTEIIPDPKYQEVLKGIELDGAEIADFMKVFDVLLLNASGASFAVACEQAGINPATFYNPRWRNLTKIARRVIMSQKLIEVENQVNKVFAKTPEMIDSIVNVALNATRELDRVKAVELLYTMFPGMVGGQDEEDAQPQKDYLKKPKNFNPMTPIVNVTIQMPEEKIIDVTPSSDDSYDDLQL